MRRLGLRARFALLAALLVLGVGAAVAAAGYFTLRHSLVAQAQRLARDQATQLVSLTDVPGGSGADAAGNRVDINDPALSHELLRSGLLLRIDDAGGRPIQRSPRDLALGLPSALRARCLRFGAAAGRLAHPAAEVACRRVGTAARPAGTISVAAPLRVSLGLLTTLRRALIISLLAAAALAAGLALALAQRALRPVRRIAGAAESIRAGELGHRIAYDGPRDELGRLADTIDACFSELEQAVARQRRFVADASHELKTPIAAIRAHVELLRGWAGGEPRAREQALRSLDQSARTAARLVADLLYLAQLDREPPRARARVRLDQLVVDLVRDAGPLRPEVGIRVKRLDECETEGDEPRLAQILLNLLDNALRVSPEAGEVEVALQANGAATVSVSDRGPGIPAAELERVFDRFYRAGHADDRKKSGAGLGLAIARSIANDHGGALVAANRAGGGAVFTLTLPLVASSPNSHRALTEISSVPATVSDSVPHTRR